MLIQIEIKCQFDLTVIDPTVIIATFCFNINKSLIHSLFKFIRFPTATMITVIYSDLLRHSQMLCMTVLAYLDPMFRIEINRNLTFRFGLRV